MISDLRLWQFEGIGKSELVKITAPDRYNGEQPVSAEIPSGELLKAIKADCGNIDFYQAMSYNAHSADDNGYFWVSYGENYGNSFTININRLFTRTIDLLERYGIPHDKLFRQE